MRYLTLAVTFLICSLSAYAQDTRKDFIGSAQATFSDPYWTGKTCSYTGTGEVKAIDDPQYAMAFSYTLSGLTPVADDCFRPYSGEFSAICRSWVTSTGTMNIDVVGVGVITVTPRDPVIRQQLSASSVNAGYGWGPTRTLYYRITILPDGSVEFFAFVPRL